MDIRDIKELIRLLRGSDVTEFSLDNHDVQLTIKRGAAASTEKVTIAPTPAVAVQTPVAQETASVVQETTPVVQEAAPATPVENANYHYITAPLVGTFYDSSSPDSAPYVKVGDKVTKGQTLCIIEAMKLMNEIEADVDGVVKEILIENAHPVEFGSKIFAIEPN